MGTTRSLCLEPVMKFEARAFDLTLHRIYPGAHLIQVPFDGYKGHQIISSLSFVNKRNLNAVFAKNLLCQLMGLL